MASLNKVLLMGNLTRDPKLKETNSGNFVCDFGLAVNRSYKSQGELQQDVCYVEIVVWGKQAESTAKYMSKGKAILVEGRLKFEQWQDQEGKNKSKHIVVAEVINFLPRAEKRDIMDDNSNSQSYESNSDGTDGFNNNDVYKETDTDVPF